MDKVIEQIHLNKVVIQDAFNALDVFQLTNKDEKHIVMLEKVNIQTFIKALQSYLPTTPATSWEEVKQKASEEWGKKTAGESVVKYGLNFNNFFVEYLSRHWPVSPTYEKGIVEEFKKEPVTFILTNIMRHMSHEQIHALIRALSERYPSPTPMAETWEGMYGLESKIDDEIREKIKDVKPESKRRILFLECKIYRLREFILSSYPSAPSLHQVDRWVRVEDVEPQPKKKYWVYGRILKVMGGFETYVSEEPYYYKDGNWVTNRGASIVATITHYMPYEPPSAPPLPAAPETDKKEAE